MAESDRTSAVTRLLHYRYRSFGLSLVLVLWLLGLYHAWAGQPADFTGRHLRLVIATTLTGLAALYKMAISPRRSLSPALVFAAATLVLCRLLPVSAILPLPFAAAWMLGATLKGRQLLWASPLYMAAIFWSTGVAARHFSFSEIGQSAFSLSMIFILARSIDRLRESRDEQMRLSEELRQANAELLQRSIQAEELAILRERNRVARELHDTLGHALTTMTVQLEAIRRVAERQPERLEPLLLEAQALSRQAMRDLRESLSSLREQEGAPGLSEQIRSLARQAAERAGCTLHLDLQPVPLPTPSVHTLAAIAREALFNAERHARAQNLHLQLRADAESVQLMIQDDGVGFEPAHSHAGHFGLAGMRERALLLGGTLTVASGPGEGTTIVVRIPLVATTGAAALPEMP